MASTPEQKAVKPRQRRAYEGAIVNRLTHGWVTSSTSADTEIDGSIVKLRDRSRQLRRDSPYVRQAIRAIVFDPLLPAQAPMRSGWLRCRTVACRGRSALRAAAPSASP